MLTQRQMCILTLLSEQSLPCGQIAESLSVSPGTVRNDLRQIQEYLEKTGRGSIISTPGVGFSLHSSQRCAGQHDTGRGFQISERSFYIGMRLLQVRPGEAVTETKLSEELYISRSSVSRALESLQELLSRFDLTIEKKKNQGILLAGDEFNKRLAWAQLCRSHMTGKGEKHREWSHRDFGEPQEWEKILPGIELDRIDRLIRRLEGEYDPIDEAEKYLELFIHLGLSLYRSSKKYRICLKKRPQLVQQLEEMRGFMERLDVIWQEEMDRFLPREEKEYIGICILFSGILKSSAMDYQRRRLLSSPEFQAFFREFTQVMREVCTIDLSREQQMQEAFCYHVSGLIFRMKNGLRTKNPLLKEIRRTYPSIYGASWFSSILFEKYFGIVVTDDEIAYLTTYLAAAKERARPFITACVVCNYGVSVSQLLCERLRRVIPEIEIVDILPRKKFEELSRRGEIGWDVVISAVEGLILSRPILYVSPILTKAEEQALREFMESCQNDFRAESRRAAGEADEDKSDENEDGEEKGRNLCAGSLVILDFPAADKEEVIHCLCERLVKAGRVMAEFEDSVIYREKMVSTEVGRGVAIPHGNPAYVRRSSVAVARMRRPVLWAEHQKVDIVFLIACESGENGQKNGVGKLKSFYRMLAVLLEDEQQQKFFREARDIQKICALINGADMREEMR